MEEKKQFLCGVVEGKMSKMSEVMADFITNPLSDHVIFFLPRGDHF